MIKKLYPNPTRLNASIVYMNNEEGTRYHSIKIYSTLIPLCTMENAELECGNYTLYHLLLDSYFLGHDNYKIGVV